MRIIKTLSLLGLMLLLMSACEENRNTAEQELATRDNVDHDQMTNRWGEAWQSNQYDSVRNQTADDAILLLNGREFPQDSIDPWLEWTTTNIQGLELNSMEKGGEGNMAWDSGTFSHTYVNDSVNYNGTYTFIWERSDAQDAQDAQDAEDAQEDEWKVSVMHISNNMERDTMNMQQNQQQDQQQMQ